MQRKTIAKIIKTKLESWLESITDEALRKEVKDNIVVSGGSICSLFQMQDVNDYDVYLKSEQVAYKVALYYTKAFDLKVFSHSRDKITNTEEVNGGIESITRENLQPGQVKIFLAKDHPAGLRTPFSEEKLGKYLPLFFSPNAISLSDDVQIVLRFTGSVQEIHKSFDFIHATNYYTFEEGLVTNIKALESIMTRQLYYQGSLYPLTTIFRMKKFIKRGWNVNAGEMLKAMFQISKLDLSDLNVLEDQIAGIDVMILGALVEVLKKKRESDPDFTLTFEYLVSLIDKLFSEDGEDETIQPDLIAENE